MEVYMVKESFASSHITKKTNNKQGRQDLYQSTAEYKRVAMCDLQLGLDQNYGWKDIQVPKRSRAGMLDSILYTFKKNQLFLNKQCEYTAGISETETAKSKSQHQDLVHES
jgi:hypothetical protein